MPGAATPVQRVLRRLGPVAMGGDEPSAALDKGAGNDSYGAASSFSLDPLRPFLLYLLREYVGMAEKLIL